MAASVRVVVPWGARAIVPVHPVESLALGLLDPVVDGGLTDVEFAGDLVLGSPLVGRRRRWPDDERLPGHFAHGDLRGGMRFFSPDYTGAIGMMVAQN